MDAYVKNAILEGARNAQLMATSAKATALRAKKDVNYLRNSGSTEEERALRASLDVSDQRVLEIERDSTEMREMLLGVLSGRLPINGENGTASSGGV